jgi:hypothetical protein
LSSAKSQSAVAGTKSAVATTTMRSQKCGERDGPRGDANAECWFIFDYPSEMTPRKDRGQRCVVDQ